jgi:hypothetical protein
LILVPAMYVTVNRIAAWNEDRRARRNERRTVRGEGMLQPPRIAAPVGGD